MPRLVEFYVVMQVRLWTESILQAASVINAFLEDGEVCIVTLASTILMELSLQTIGGEDLPSLVLFLTCHAETENLAAQVSKWFKSKS